jgi:rhodanese-related sulfurtransferase
MLRQRTFDSHSGVRRRLLAGLAAAAVAPLAGLRAAEVPAPDAGVPSITPATLAGLLAASSRVLLFDVRDGAEYDVAHIAGAELVPPETGHDAFLALVAAHAAGATFVFYCTAGARSDGYAQGVIRELIEAGAEAVLVLAGGIIAWHNDGRPMVDRDGRPTEHVHPYDAEYARLLLRPYLARYALAD